MAKKMTLKACPFCAAKAYWCKGDRNTRMNDLVQCSECPAEMEGDYKPMSALEAWNTRCSSYAISQNDRLVNIEGENL